MTKYSAISDEEPTPPFTTVGNPSVIGSLDQDPLLSDQVIEVEEDLNNPLATASYFSCAINLANTILGTGMLAMPAAIASVGIILGSFMIVFSAFASGLGLYFLSRAASRTEGRQSSFFAVSKLTYPSAALWFDLAIATKCFGVSISYLIIIGDLMPQVVQAVGEKLLGGDEYSIFLDRRLWITLSMIVIVPLAFLKRLDSLRYTSLLGVIAVIYLSFIVVYNYLGPDFEAPPKEKIHLVRFSTKFFTHLPLFVFAFTCHQNIFTIYNELFDNSQHRINSVIVGAIGTSSIIYQFIGIMGYLSFGDDVFPNIITQYKTNMIVTIGRVAIVIHVLFTYPLQAHPCRACLDKIISSCSGWRQSSNVNSTENLLNVQRDKVPPTTSHQKYILMTTGILVSSYLIAMVVSQLDLVLAFVGSTGSTTISFILPGIFYYKIHEEHAWTKKKILSVCLAAYGFAVVTICLTLNILRALNLNE
ncbi:4742_t:CDS:2 [Ambispora leptoticha]|uniref:4742_t:CDS:1 n=1 Tax=Ambispora leptoticha TaxID=144679 RepID=A0A9N9CP35_9GLOM|nr:4742_t:CDS:2 [Ambispora leptoticha]